MAVSENIVSPISIHFRPFPSWIVIICDKKFMFPIFCSHNEETQQADW